MLSRIPVFIFGATFWMACGSLERDSYNDSVESTRCSIERANHVMDSLMHGMDSGHQAAQREIDSILHSDDSALDRFDKHDLEEGK